jgi:putative DNA primase/helicase
LNDASTDPSVIDSWWKKWPWANVGILTGANSGIIALDIDPRHNGDDTLFDLITQNGKLPNTVEAITGGGGQHLIFAHPGRNIQNDSKGAFFGQGIDVRGDGGYIVAAPSSHISGKLYEWEVSSDPMTTTPAFLPAWALQRLPKNGKTATANTSKSSKKIKAGGRNIALTQMAGAMRRRGMLTNAIELALIETNKDLCDPPLPLADVQKIAHSVGRYKPAGTVPTDDDLSAEWIEKFPDTIYGLAEFRQYKNGIWSPVNEKTIGAEILAIMQDAKGDGYKPSWFKVKSVLEIARMQVNTPNELWNANSDLIVCKNGTLTISTRKLADHKKEDYISSGVPYDFCPYADDKLWMDFLDNTIFEASEFLQEFAGYSLTTDTKLETAVWLYGPRGCGKSTFIEGLRAMLGTKAGQLGLAQLENSRFGLFDLPSKTLLFSTEQPADFVTCGHILNALISGEEVITERKFKDAEPITSNAKLLWAMNELPRIKEASSGLFRRVKVVEFPALQVKPDPLVKEHIKYMGAAILNWALIGLDRLQRRGYFDIPSCVTKATALFEEVNDVVKIFVDECCEVDSSYETMASTLYAKYRTWCFENGHGAKSSTTLGIEDWKRLGFIRVRKNAGFFWQGVRIK